MTQDFAKIRPEPLLEKKPVDAPPAWSLMITGMVLGITIGVFACVLLYLSGNVPSLNQATPEAAARTLSAEPLQQAQAATESAQAPDPELELEFYTKLREVKVLVDATPVDLSYLDPERKLDKDYVLQTGAFQRRELAEIEMRRQEDLGLTVFVKDQTLVGRSLFLVQSGPYATNGELENAETVLRRNSIPFLRLTVQ
jgi:cell division septation protein DedD